MFIERNEIGDLTITFSEEDEIIAPLLTQVIEDEAKDKHLSVEGIFGRNENGAMTITLSREEQCIAALIVMVIIQLANEQHLDVQNIEEWLYEHITDYDVH